jgi:hypothetical protein
LDSIKQRLHTPPEPRVAEYGNPGLSVATPLGLPSPTAGNFLAIFTVLAIFVRNSRTPVYLPNRNQQLKIGPSVALLLLRDVETQISNESGRARRCLITVSVQ